MPKLQFDYKLLFGKTPEEIVAFLKSRKIAVTWNWKEQIKLIQENVFTVAKVMSADVLQDIQDSLVKNLADGGSYKQFKDEIKPLLEKKGYAVKSDGSAFQLDLIYRMNLQGSYNSGRLNQQLAIKNDFPYIQYIAVSDSRTTNVCNSLNGKVFKIEDGLNIYPPNHFRDLHPETKIRVKDGWKTINDIKIGDEVLTHKENYKNVYDVMKKTCKIEILEIETEIGTIKISPEHPVLTEKGWINAGELSLDSVLYSIKDIDLLNKIIKKQCKICGKIFEPNKKNLTQIYCSDECRHLGKRVHRYCKYCGDEILQKGKKKNQKYCSQICMGLDMRILHDMTCLNCGNKMVGKYKSPLSKERKFCSKKCYLNYTGETSIEKKVRIFLEKLNIDFKTQYKISIYHADFFLPKNNLVIEADGEYWHAKRLDRHAKREKYMLDNNFDTLHLTESDIKSGKFKNTILEKLCLKK